MAAATGPKGSLELRAFIVQLGKMPKDVRRDLRPRMKGIGQAALFNVRLQTIWSTRIPRATRLSIGLSKRNPGIAITVDRNKAPHARPYNNDDKEGTFRHPLFGNRKHWYTQVARPFLVKGARPYFEKIDAELSATVDEAARKAGFR
jgi:hypothetical protein